MPFSGCSKMLMLSSSAWFPVNISAVSHAVNISRSTTHAVNISATSHAVNISATSHAVNISRVTTHAGKHSNKTAPQISEGLFERCLAESNRCSRFCRPVPNRSAKAPFGITNVGILFGLAKYLWQNLYNLCLWRYCMPYYFLVAMQYGPT